MTHIASSILAASLLLFAGAVVYYSCAPPRPSAPPRRPGRIRPHAAPPPLIFTAARRFMAGLGWGLFAGLVLLTCGYVLLLLPS